MKGLLPKTINNLLRNVDFYINDYLLYGDLLTFDQGIEVIDVYFGDFFIRKCMWSTLSTIKSTAASLKKFYKSMDDHQKINKEDYKLLCTMIKENMDEWQSLCKEYNNPDLPNPFSMYF